MSETRAALAELAQAIRAIGPPALPSPPPTAGALRELQAVDAVPRPPGRSSLEELRDRLCAAFDGGSPHPLKPSDLARAPWILWNGEPAAADFPGLLDTLLAQARGHRRTLRNLAEAWLQNADRDHTTLARTGVHIGHLVEESVDPRLDTLRRSQRRLGLFDLSRGPVALAKAILAEGDLGVDDVLQANGLAVAGRVQSGYMRRVQAAVLTALSTALRGAHGRVALERALAFLAPGRRLRFDDTRGPVAEALLLPWTSGVAPDPSAKDEIKRFLLDHLGDPRLQPGKWAPVHDEATAVIRQWLAEASLETFFELIERHALDHQWRYRKAFWSACLGKGAIRDAWLALGSRVHANARAQRALGNAYARLRGAGGDQAVLLMDVGPLVLVEWSHAGKLWACPKDWKDAPRIGRSEYSRHDCTDIGLPLTRTGDERGISHRNPAQSWWQKRVAEFLDRRGVVRLTPSDWQPR